MVAASGDHHAVFVYPLHCALLAEELLLSSQLEHLLQILFELVDRASCENSSLRDEEGEEEIDVLAALHCTEIQGETVRAALDLLDDFVDAFVLLIKGEVLVEVVGKAEAKASLEDRPSQARDELLRRGQGNRILFQSFA
jgi:hypothetical protein